MSQEDVRSALQEASNEFHLNLDPYTKSVRVCLEAIGSEKMVDIINALAFHGKSIGEKLQSPNSEEPICPIKKLGIRLHLLAIRSKQKESEFDWKKFDFNNVVEGIEMAVSDHDNYTDLDHVLIWSLAKTINKLL